MATAVTAPREVRVLDSPLQKPRTAMVRAGARSRWVERMAEGGRIRDIENEKARRRAARQMIAEYHEQQLRLLLDHVRDGFAKMDSGEIDPFEPDDVIHHYKRAVRKLWSFCGSSGGA